MGDVKLLKILLRKGNAVWNLVDALGCVRRSPFLISDSTVLIGI